MSALSQRMEAVRRLAGVEAPVDGSFDRIALMAAKIFSTPMATVSIVDEDRVWFLATQGLDGVRQIGNEPGLCASAVLQDTPYVVNDALTDPRTLSHPLVVGDLGIRFYAAAPIITVDGHSLGTVNVLDQKRHRRVSTTQTGLLADLASTVAQMMEIRLSALSVLRAERASRATQLEHNDSADRLQDQVRITAGQPHEPQTAARCQLGGTTACQKPAEAKVADSWGDSAWGCWQHAEDALINVVPVFLASHHPNGLMAYRSRVSPPPPL